MPDLTWNDLLKICPLCGGPKTKDAKRCRKCFQGRKRRFHKRKKIVKEKSGAIPTDVVLVNGDIITVRSKLESLWITALLDALCDICYECVILNLPQEGKRGLFIGSYTPDLILHLRGEDFIYVEFKPTKKLAKEDTRPRRALELNRARFLVIGGYPNLPFYVKLLSREGEKEYEEVNLKQLMQLLNCGGR